MTQVVLALVVGSVGMLAAVVVARSSGGRSGVSEHRTVRRSQRAVEIGPGAPVPIPLGWGHDHDLDEPVRPRHGRTRRSHPTMRLTHR